MRVRIGIHSGEAAAAGERYVGFSVHRAARIGARRARRAGAALVVDARTGRGRPAAGRLPARSRLVSAEGRRPAGADLAGRRGRAAGRVPSAARRSRRSSRRPLRRRSLLAATLVGVIAAAVAIPVFALGGGSGETSLEGVGADSVGADRLRVRPGRRFDPRGGVAGRGRCGQGLGLGDERGRRLRLPHRPEDEHPLADDYRSAAAPARSRSAGASSGPSTAATGRSRRSTQARSAAAARQSTRFRSGTGPPVWRSGPVGSGWRTRPTGR